LGGDDQTASKNKGDDRQINRKRRVRCLGEATSASPILSWQGLAAARWIAARGNLTCRVQGGKEEKKKIGARICRVFFGSGESGKKQTNRESAGERIKKEPREGGQEDTLTGSGRRKEGRGKGIDTSYRRSSDWKGTATPKLPIVPVKNGMGQAKTAGLPFTIGREERGETKNLSERGPRRKLSRIAI